MLMSALRAARHIQVIDMASMLRPPLSTVRSSTGKVSEETESEQSREGQDDRVIVFSAAIEGAGLVTVERPVTSGDEREAWVAPPLVRRMFAALSSIVRLVHRRGHDSPSRRQERP